MGGTQTYFDAAERDRLRRALLRYMEDNRIGVPTLQRLVAEANDIVVDRVPLKTLQRFLGDTHRSNDAMVRFCQRFVATTPDDDPVDQFGEQAAAFHATPAPPLALDQCAGTFEGIAEVRQKGLALHNPDATTKVSDLILTERTGARFLRAEQFVSGWRADAAPKDKARRAYEGAAVMTAAGLVILLRNILTGAPRTYWLTAVPEGFAGQGTEPAGSLDAEPPGVLDRLAFERPTFRRVEKTDG